MARYLPAFLFASALLGGMPASAQTVQTTIATGANPQRVTVNPVTNTIYVTNYDSNTVSAINGATGAVTTIPVGTRPTWIAVNPETNKIYVSNAGANGFGPSLMVLNGATQTVSSTLNVGDVGWTAINQVTNKVYVVRYGNGDEVNIILDERYVNTAATRSYQPVAIALNPYTNMLYIVHRATGDVTAIDARVDQSVVQDNINNYPPLLCPNGSGGYKPSPGPTDPDPGPCINVNDPPAVVAVNPVTDTIYSASDGTTGQIAVIRGSTKTNPHTFTALSPPGVTGAAKAIAVNPVSNKVYAVFANHIVIVNGADNAMTVIPSTGPVAIGINTSTNKIYVPHADGTLKVIDGATNAVTATLTTPAGATAIAVNPVTNMVYVVTAAGLTPVVGAPGSASIPLTVTFTPLPGDTSTGITTTIETNAGASGGFAAPRRVYWQLDSTGPWSLATNNGGGSFTLSFPTPSNGTHTVRAFATNALDAPAISTDVQHNPLIGMIASYTFTAGSGGPVNPSLSLMSSQNPSTFGQGVTFTASVTGSAGSGTGTVSFLDGGTAIAGCASVALSGGTAACTVSSLAIGTHPVTAQYSGSTAYNPATSSAIQQSVKANSAVGLASSANPSTAGQSVTFTASVTGSAGVATGTVNFLDGGVSISGCAAVALASGSATCATAALSTAAHQITAQYSGNASYFTATSSALTQTVNAAKVDPGVGVSSSINPSTVGQSVTFTANVTGSAGVATGTVDFRDGAVSISGCASVALGSGTATCTVSSLAVGTHPVTAQYSGSASYNSATSPAIQQVVKADSAVGLASSLNPSTAGQSVTFTANVTGSAGVATGTVDFLDGGVAISGCAAVALASGSANCATSALGTGTHQITAQYSGNASYFAATSGALTQTVNVPPKVNPSVGVSSSLNPSTTGQSVTFTASVTGSAGVASGTVDFRDGAASISGCAAVALSSGSATCATNALAAGNHTITASYSGDAGYNPAGSTTLTQAVNAPAKANPSVGVSSSLNPSTAGQSVTFTASVTGSAGVASGTVDFRDGAASISGCAAVALSSGSATCATNALAAGNHSIMVSYSGDAAYNPAGSTTLTQTVNPAGPPSTNVALASAGASASASSQLSQAFPPSSTINNERAGAGWGNGGGWSSSSNTGPDWLQVDFAGTRTIDRVVVYTVQDAWNAPSEPTDAMTFSRYGVVDFAVDGWNGTSWITLAMVTGNNLVKRTVSFAPFTTNRIRVRAVRAVDSWARIVEVEAWAGASNVALASTGAAASASSQINSSFPASAAIDGERAGASWGNGGGWSSMANAGPDWLQVDFAGAKTIDHVVLYTVQDAWQAPSEPTDAMTFSRYGLVDFIVDGWNGTDWVALGTAANNNLVKRTVNFTPFTTNRIRVRMIRAVDAWARVTELEAWGVAATAQSNVALASAGAAASASSLLSPAFPPSSTINNERAGVNWGNGGGWSSSSNTGPDWLRVDFAGTQTIDRVVVYTVQDAWNAPSEPTDAMTFSRYGVVDFAVDGWNGTSWITLAMVTGNNLVKRTVNFTPFTTNRIRVRAIRAVDAWARIVEIEAWAGASNVALASTGAAASASGQYNSSFPAASAIDGERAGATWGNGGGWSSAANAGPDWLRVDFAGTRTIDHVALYTVQDAWQTPSEPSDAMTFSRYGVVDFIVDGWNGTDWVALGTAANNNLVKRTVNFTPFTTSRIRVRMVRAVDAWARVTEVEAWGN